VKGSDRGEQQQQQEALGEGTGTLPYTLACTVKSRSSLALTLMTKREEKKEKRSLLLPELGSLASYVGYVPCVSILSVLGVVSTPPHWDTEKPDGTYSGFVIGSGSLARRA
jgi:hypothetical protein